MSSNAAHVHVVVRIVGDGMRPAEVHDHIRRHGGEVVEDATDAVTVSFEHVPDAVAYAGSLVDDTAEAPRAVAISIGGDGNAATIAGSAQPGQVLAEPSIESRSRGRLSCGLSFTRTAAVDEVVYRLVVPGSDDRFQDVE